MKLAIILMAIFSLNAHCSEKFEFNTQVSESVFNAFNDLGYVKTGSSTSFVKVKGFYCSLDYLLHTTHCSGKVNGHKVTIEGEQSDTLYGNLSNELGFEAFPQSEYIEIKKMTCSKDHDSSIVTCSGRVAE